MSNISRLIVSLFVLMFQCGAQETEVTLTIGAKEITVVDGSRAYLFCSTNVLNREIYWTYNSSRLKRTKVAQKGEYSVLSLQPSRKRNDEGYYQCHISVGNDVISSDVMNLEILPNNKIPPGFPEITEKMLVRTFEKGSTASMPCKSEGDPEPLITWYKGEFPLQADDPRISILPIGTLVISNASESDREHYFCSASNRMGVAFSASANLYVKERVIPPYFFKKPESRVITTGQKVNITCIAAGSPTPHVRFIKDISPNDTLAGGSGKVDLILGAVKANLNLSCIANSSHGQIREYFKIRVSDEIISTPVKLKAEQLSPYSAKVSWACETHDHVTFIIKFKVISDSGPHQMVSTSQNHVVLTSLMPASYYDVYIMTRRDRDESSPAYLRFQTLHENNIVLSASVYLKSKDSVLLTWTSNYSNHQVFKEFVVKYGVAPTSVLDIAPKSVNNYVILGKLLENKEYVFGVTPILKSENELKSSVANIIMPSRSSNFKTPEKPSNLQHEVSEHIFLSWSFQDDSIRNAMQDHIVVYCKLSALGEEYCQAVHTYSPLASFELAGLEANSSYSAKIAGIQGKIVGEFSDEIIFQTHSHVIQNLTTQSLSSTSFLITWISPQFITNDLKSTFVLRYNIAPTNSAEGSTNIVKIDSSDTRFILKNLQKFKRYRIRMMSGNGKFVSRIAYDTTMEDLPDAPTGLSVKVVNASTALVKWNEEGDWKANGLIIGYNIDLQEIERSDEGTKRTSGINIRNGSEYLLTNLTPLVEYQVRVFASTKVGEGAPTSSKRFRTKKEKSTDCDSALIPLLCVHG